MIPFTHFQTITLPSRFEWVHMLPAAINIQFLHEYATIMALPTIGSHSPISSARITPLSWSWSNSRNNNESSHGIMNTRIQEYCLLTSPTHLQPIPTFNTTIELGFEVSFFSWSFRGNPLYPQRNGCFGKAQPFTFALRFLQFTMQVFRLFQ